MSSRSSRRGRRTRKQEWENVREANETSENVNCLNDVEMEYGDVDKKVEVEHVKEWDMNQKLVGIRKKKDRLKRDATHQKTSSVNSVRFNGENSCSDKTPNIVKRGALPTTKPELSNGKTDFNNDGYCMKGEDTADEYSAGKRKRCSLNCDNYNSKFQGRGLICIGILPGLKSVISSSDDSDQSCSSESENNEKNKYDLLGRKIVYVEKKSTESK